MDNVKMAFHQGMAYPEGSTKYQVDDTLIFAHQSSGHIITYHKKTRAIIANKKFNELGDFEKALNDLLGQTNQLINKKSTDFYGFKEGTVLESHSSTVFEKNEVSFYQVISVDQAANGGYPSVSFVRIPKDEIDFGNHKRAVPLIGTRCDGVVYKSDLIKGSLILPNGTAVFPSDYDELVVGGSLKVKIYKHVCYGMVV